MKKKEGKIKKKSDNQWEKLKEFQELNENKEELWESQLRRKIRKSLKEKEQHIVQHPPHRTKGSVDQEYKDQPKKKT